MVYFCQLGFVEAYDSSCTSPPRSYNIPNTFPDIQIIPAESNGIDAINFRAMRDSKSVDLERNDDIIHATAQFTSDGSTTPGIQTPLELIRDLTPELPSSRSRSGSAAAKKKEVEEVNPFGEFSSVTRDIGDW
jgi:protein-serine/threonine kinase